MTALLLLRKSKSAERSVTCAPCLDATGRRLSIQAVSKYVVGPRSVSFSRLRFFDGKERDGKGKETPYSCS